MCSKVITNKMAFYHVLTRNAYNDDFKIDSADLLNWVSVLCNMFYAIGLSNDNMSHCRVVLPPDELKKTPDPF